MKAFKVTVISLGIIILLLYKVGYYFFQGLCGNTIISTSTSPDGRWKIVLFERSCGATTGFSTQIALLESGEVLDNESGNIYIASGYPNGYDIHWQSNEAVKIKGIRTRVNKKIELFKGIHIYYE